MAREDAELGALESELADKMRWTIALWALRALFSLAVFTLLGRTLWLFIRRQESLSEAAVLAKARMEEGMQTLQAHSAEVSALSQMARVLQTEMGMREALEVTALFCARLLPGSQGVLFLFRNSADILENAARWGGDAVDAAPRPSSRPPAGACGSAVRIAAAKPITCGAATTWTPARSAGSFASR